VTADIGSARTDAATRTASVLVANSWSARRMSARSIVCSSSLDGERVQERASRDAIVPRCGPPSTDGTTANSRRACSAGPSPSGHPAIVVAHSVSDPIGSVAPADSTTARHRRRSSRPIGHETGSLGSLPDQSNSATCSYEHLDARSATAWPRNLMPSSSRIVTAEPILTSIDGRSVAGLRFDRAASRSSCSRS
jgi:hypothetical protein